MPPTPSDIHECETLGWDGDRHPEGWDEDWPLMASDFRFGGRYADQFGNVALGVHPEQTLRYRVIVGVVVEGDLVGEFVFENCDECWREVK